MIISYIDSLYFLGLKDSDLSTSEKALMEEYIKSSEKLILKYLNRVIEQTEFTEYINGKDTQREVIRNYPIDDTQGVKLYCKSNYGNTFEELSPAYYEVDYASGIINKDTYFEKGFKNYKIVYTGGYASDSIPSAIKLAIKTLLKIFWEKRDQNAEGLISYHAGDVIQKYDEDIIPLDIKRFLNSYKDYSFR